MDKQQVKNAMTDEGKNLRLLIKDLVDVPEIKTVIQLEDLKAPELRRMIVETFVITGEVEENLRSIFTSLSRQKGRGIFLKGHFGSGKSHFLSMLSLLLRYPQSWETVISQVPSLADFEEKIRGLRFLVVDISLVQHRGSELLEEIFLSSIIKELGTETKPCFEGAHTRHETFRKIKALLKEHRLSGMFILVDELSEFLRSKADAHAYNEDIRFLQYLGEEAEGFPLWIVASLQEWIEETGEIHQDTFNKIKDRYRIRLTLGRAHIEELVSGRLIRHKEGAETKISAVFEELKSYFPTFPVTRERFSRLYPVHPATSSLLDRLKPLFSEHRGVVDFIHFRLKGDPERHIPCRLDREAQELLTPEVIFDHFLDRIKERSETQVYLERVFDACQSEIPELFKDHDQQKIAFVVIKLLILFAITPVRYKYTVRHIAEMVLFRITSMESEINYQFLYDILDRLSKEGSYIRVETRDDPLDNVYYIDLKADMAGIIRRRIRHMAQEIFPEDQRLFTKLACMVDSPCLPLRDWVENDRQKVSLMWQHTRRNGTLFLRPLDELTLEEIAALARQNERSEEDFFIMVGTTHNRDKQFRNVKDVLLPGVCAHYRGTFLFWLPEQFKGDITWVKEILAAILLKEKMDGDSSEKGKQGDAFLKAFIENGKKRIIELFTGCYYHGTLLWDENRVDISRYGLLSREKFMSEFVTPILGCRFPRHNRIQPYMDAPTTGILKDMLIDFLSNGMLLVDDYSKHGVRDILEGLLRPMGLVKKKGIQYELQVNPQQNELARHFFDEMGQKETVPVEEMYWTFRKGEYGLLMPHFEILVLALLFSGHLVAYKGVIRKGPDELVRSGLKGITSLGKGEILEEELRKIITTHPLIPKKFRNIPVTLASQEELWSELKSQKASALEDLETLKSRIKWAASFEAFRNIRWEELITDIESLIAQWEEIKISLSSKEGLERFIAASRGEPFLDKKIMTVEESGVFLKHAERALFIYQYVTDPKLHIPDEKEYIGLKEARSEILRYYEEMPGLNSAFTLDGLFRTFQDFQEAYTKLYVEAHHKARGGDQFEAYDQLNRSRRYDLLRRLDRIEMISVEHNRRSIDQGIASVLLNRCLLSPRDQLQGRPVCSCGFRIGETALLKPIKEIEKKIDQGIIETLEALRALSMQEKLIPYLKGLDLVGKKKEAGNIRQLLEISLDEKGILDRLDRILNSDVIREINGAFRGRVVIVKRDLDKLYKSLVHRKYTMSRTRKIIKDWIEEETITDDTFLHFLGGGEKESVDLIKDRFSEFLEARFNHLFPLYREVGSEQFAKALIGSIWALQYDIQLDKFIEIFPFLDRGAETENLRWFNHLSEAAGYLRSKNQDLFESLVLQVEEDLSFIQVLWSIIPSVSPEGIFTKESIFPLMLKEAFERLLCEMPKKAEMAGLTGKEWEEDSTGPVFKERKKEMIDALKIYHLLKEKILILKSPEESAFKCWESCFVRDISPVSSLIGHFREKLKRIGTEIPPFLKQEEKEAEKKIQTFTEDFKGFYRNALPDWEKGEGARPVMIHDIPSILSGKRGVPDHKQVYYLLMDGMRLDLWEVIKSDFFGKSPNLFRIVREGVLWANQPTLTAEQLVRFEGALKKVRPGINLEEIFWKVSGIDEKIHTEKGPLTYLFAGIIRYLELELLFRLRKLPPRTLLILFSDHGFVENPFFNYKDKYESPRYIHGKDSPFEVIVPWAWVMRL